MKPNKITTKAIEELKDYKTALKLREQTLKDNKPLLKQSTENKDKGIARLELKNKLDLENIRLNKGGYVIQMNDPLNFDKSEEYVMHKKKVCDFLIRLDEFKKSGIMAKYNNDVANVTQPETDIIKQNDRCVKDIVDIKKLIVDLEKNKGK